MSKKKNTCCSLPKFEPTECSVNTIKQKNIKFENGKMYEDGIYQGDVEEDEEGLFVVRKSKNKYMNGQKIRIVIIKPKEDEC